MPESTQAQAVPPFGSKRAAALALYRPPFRFDHGYIFDADNHMVADQGGIADGEVETHIIARVRGWGRISYMPNAEALQDEAGAIVAEALTQFYGSLPVLDKARQALEKIAAGITTAYDEELGENVFVPMHDEEMQEIAGSVLAELDEALKKGGQHG